MNRSDQSVAESKNALITGGVQGIGRAIVDQFLARNNHVFVFDCIAPDDKLAQELISIGVSYIQVDVSSHDSITNGFTKLFSELGTKPLDILVNNAGIARDMLAIRMSESDWDSVLAVNLKGAFLCAQQALKRMVKQKKSYIINMSSVVGLVGNPGQINYAASKAGLIAVTKTLAKEYASRNILVNAIAPGFIQTRLTEKLSDKVKQQALEHIPLKRFGTPEDVAHLISFLTSGCADYITGQVVTIDGGMLLN
jgi:3-oxoacyl-[acyl-carrier protein] reductase